MPCLSEKFSEKSVLNVNSKVKSIVRSNILIKAKSRWKIEPNIRSNVRSNVFFKVKSR